MCTMPSSKANDQSAGKSKEAKQSGDVLIKRYKSKCSKYKRRLHALQDELEKLRQQQTAQEAVKVELQQLKEQIKRDEALQTTYYDALDAQGLICGVCLEEVVGQEDSMACCSNKLCNKCEKQVAAKHQQCPFCRAPMTPEQQPGQHDQQAATAGQHDHAPPAGMQHAAHAWAAVQAFLAARREQGYDQEGFDREDSEGEYDGVDSEDPYEDEYEDDEEGAAAHDTLGQDATVLMAAAAEAMYAARRAPEGKCGLCGSSYLMSALAMAEQLPDLLLCRSCWRNIPDLASQRFPAGALARSSAAAAGAAALPGVPASGTAVAAMPGAAAGTGGGPPAGARAGAATGTTTAAAAAAAGAAGRPASASQAANRLAGGMHAGGGRPAAAQTAVAATAGKHSSKKKRKQHGKANSGSGNGSTGVGSTHKHALVAKSKHSSSAKKSHGAAAAAGNVTGAVPAVGLQHGTASGKKRKAGQQEGSIKPSSSKKASKKDKKRRLHSNNSSGVLS